MQGLVLTSLMLSQIASATSRPEEAPAQVLGTSAAEAYADAASLLTPDEALRSIHEEPDEVASLSGGEAPRSAGRRPSGACPEDQMHGSSRGPSFMQPAAGMDRQSTQPSLPSGVPSVSTQPSPPPGVVCSRLYPFHAQCQQAGLGLPTSYPRLWCSYWCISATGLRSMNWHFEQCLTEAVLVLVQASPQLPA